MCCLALPASAGVPWYDTDWNNRMQFTALNSSVSGTDVLTNMTLAIILDSNHSDIFTGAKSDGSDLRITDTTGTVILSHELVSYDNSGQTAEIWIKYPDFSSRKKDIYVYYGNSSASSSSDPSSVWSDYALVLHYESDPADATQTDSSGNNNATNTGAWSTTHRQPGVLGQSWLYDPEFRTVNCPDLNVTGAWYVSMWAKPTENQTNMVMQTYPCDSFLAIQGDSGSTAGRPQLRKRTNWGVCSGSLANEANQVTWNGNTVTLDSWAYYGFALEESPFIPHIWQNGVDTGNDLYVDYDSSPQLYSATDPTLWQSDADINWQGENNSLSGEPVGIGGTSYANATTDEMRGLVDEFRIRNIVPSDDWVLTEYNNQVDNATFWTEGSEEYYVADGDCH